MRILWNGDMEKANSGFIQYKLKHMLVQHSQVSKQEEELNDDALSDQVTNMEFCPDPQTRE